MRDADHSHVRACLTAAAPVGGNNSGAAGAAPRKPHRFRCALLSSACNCPPPHDFFPASLQRSGLPDRRNDTSSPHDPSHLTAHHHHRPPPLPPTTTAAVPYQSCSVLFLPPFFIRDDRHQHPQAWDSGVARDPQIPALDRAPHPKAPVRASRARDHADLQLVSI